MQDSSSVNKWQTTKLPVLSQRETHAAVGLFTTAMILVWRLVSLAAVALPLSAIPAMPSEELP